MVNKDARKILAIVIALTVGGILIAQLLPVAISSISEDDTSTLTQDSGVEAVVVDGQLNSTSSNVDTTTTPNQADIKLKDVESGNTESKTVGVGNTKTFQPGDESVDVTLDSVDTSASPNQTTISYSYPSDYGWDSGSKSIWALMPLFFVVAALIALAGLVLRAM